MKYILKTVKNETGHKVFFCVRNGRKFIYWAKDENGNVGTVDKNWILHNQKDIVNLGISGTNIYPKEIKKQDNEELDNQLNIVYEVYQELFSELMVSYDNNCLEYTGYTSDGGEIVRGIEIENLYDLNTLFEGLCDVANNFDADYEAKISMGKEDFGKDCSLIDDEDIEEDEDYRYLQWRYEAMVDYQQKLKDMTFGWVVKLEKKGYDRKYADRLLKKYGHKELSEVITMWD